MRGHLTEGSAWSPGRHRAGDAGPLGAARGPCHVPPQPGRPASALWGHSSIGSDGLPRAGLTSLPPLHPESVSRSSSHVTGRALG